MDARWIYAVIVAVAFTGICTAVALLDMRDRRRAERQEGSPC